MNEYLNHPNFPNNPSYAGYQDDLLTGGTSWLDYYGFRMEAYFIPPVTGVYFFRIFCDNICIFNMGQTEQSKSVVIDYRQYGHTGYLAYG